MKKTSTKTSTKRPAAPARRSGAGAVTPFQADDAPLKPVRPVRPATDLVPPQPGPGGLSRRSGANQLRTSDAALCLRLQYREGGDGRRRGELGRRHVLRPWPGTSTISWMTSALRDFLGSLTPAIGLFEDVAEGSAAAAAFAEAKARRLQ